MDDLPACYSKLELSEEESVTIRGRGGAGNSAIKESGFVVVASLLSIQPFNYKALGRTMEMVWRSVKGMEFKKIGYNLMLFTF